MGTPYLGELRIMSFNFAPKGWALSNGQILPINQNQALFSLLGTQFGGNGQTTFALPDIRGKVPVHWGAGSFQVIGQTTGTVSTTLTIPQLPAHNHGARAKAKDGLAGLGGITPDSTKAVAQGLVSLQGDRTVPAQIYGTGSPDRVMSPGTIGATGGSQPHENMQPYLTLSFCIALQGIFPSQN